MGKIKPFLLAIAISALLCNFSLRAQELAPAPEPSNRSDIEQRFLELEQKYNLLANQIQSGDPQAPGFQAYTPQGRGTLTENEAALISADNQLELRVPSYWALPENQVKDLQGEFMRTSDLMKNFMFIHGYLRSGFGANGQGGDQEVFMAPGALAKYRLGNENDTYGELSFSKASQIDKRGPIFRGEVMLAFQTKQNSTFDPEGDIFAVRQCYVEATNFPRFSEWIFWAGNRYYRRHDVHINDFYFLDMSGYGGGVENIAFINDSKLAVAYIGGSTENIRFDGGRIAKHNLDMRIYDINVPLGTGIFWSDLAMTPAGTLQDDSDGKTARGFAVGFIHIIEDLWGGFNKASVQWGRGAAANFTTDVSDPSEPINGSSQFLFTNTLTVQPCDALAMQATTIANVRENGQGVDGQVTWISGGMRPILFFTEHFSLAFEYGVDWVDNEPEDCKGAVHKFTLAPQLTPSNHFFSRPALRTFVTYAAWPESLKGKVGTPAYANSTEGWSMGCQLEVWW